MSDRRLVPRRCLRERLLNRIDLDEFELPSSASWPCLDGKSQRPHRRRLFTQADGHAERVAALALIEPRADRPGRITLGADKGYDVQDFVNECRSMNVTPHVAAKATGSAIGRAHHPARQL